MNTTSLEKFNLSNLRFGEPKDRKVGNFGYKTIKIKREKNGKPIDLLIRTNEVFSFGVNEDDSHENALYSLPLCLYTRNDIKDKEKEWVSKFGEIVEKCNRKVRKSIGKLGKVEALHWKEDDQGAGAIIYAKIPFYKGKFRSNFYNDYNEPDENSLEYET